MQLEFDRDTVAGEPFETGYGAVDFLAANFGPLIMLRGRLESTGAWADLREKLATIYGRGEPGEYLIVLGRKT